MEELIDGNRDNAQHLLKHLKNKGYWQHFINISNFHGDLVRFNDPEIVSSYVKMAWLHFISGASTNLRKGIYNVLCGGLTDSSIYVRRTIEGIRYSTYFRDNPDAAILWFNPNEKKRSDDGYRKWLNNSGGDLVEAEMPNSRKYFKLSSNYGPHPNAELFSQQHVVSIQKDVMQFTALNHELSADESGTHRFLGIYFWHLRVHSSAIDWWITKSGFINHLNKMQRDYWQECRSARERDDGIVKAIIFNGPIGKESPGI
jgi:hypothetical protein